MTIEELKAYIKRLEASRAEASRLFGYYERELKRREAQLLELEQKKGEKC